MAKPDASTRLSVDETTYRLLVNAVVDCAIFRIDPQAVVANWNVGAERIKGYTAQEIIGSISTSSTPRRTEHRVCPSRSHSGSQKGAVRG